MSAKEKMDKAAVIATGGKQYHVREGETIDVELLEGDPEGEVRFAEVLMLQDGDKTHLGAPNIKGAEVVGTVLERFKGEKVIVFKKKRRKDYKRLRGHRQNLIKIRIDRISMAGAK